MRNHSLSFLRREHVCRARSQQQRPTTTLAYTRAMFAASSTLASPASAAAWRSKSASGASVKKQHQRRAPVRIVARSIAEPTTPAVALQAGERRQKAIVVGGGVGGLGTAARLAHAGYEVTVLEKNDASGGRVGDARALHIVISCATCTFFHRGALSKITCCVLCCVDNVRPARSRFHHVFARLSKHGSIEASQYMHRTST
jgi:hypothetical protein